MPTWSCLWLHSLSSPLWPACDAQLEHCSGNTFFPLRSTQMLFNIETFFADLNLHSEDCNHCENVVFSTDRFEKCWKKHGTLLKVKKKMKARKTTYFWDANRWCVTSSSFLELILLSRVVMFEENFNPASWWSSSLFPVTSLCSTCLYHSVMSHRRTVAPRKGQNRH